MPHPRRIIHVKNFRNKLLSLLLHFKKDIYIIFRKSEKKKEVQVKQKVGKITTKPHSKIERRKIYKKVKSLILKESTLIQQSFIMFFILCKETK